MHAAQCPHRYDNVSSVLVRVACMQALSRYEVLGRLYDNSGVLVC